MIQIYDQYKLASSLHSLQVPQSPLVHRHHLRSWLRRIRRFLQQLPAARPQKAYTVGNVTYHIWFLPEYAFAYFFSFFFFLSFAATDLALVLFWSALVFFPSFFSAFPSFFFTSDLLILSSFLFFLSAFRFWSIDKIRSGKRRPRSSYTWTAPFSFFTLTAAFAALIAAFSSFRCILAIRALCSLRPGDFVFFAAAIIRRRDSYFPLYLEGHRFSRMRNRDFSFWVAFWSFHAPWSSGAETWATCKGSSYLASDENMAQDIRRIMKSKFHYKTIISKEQFNMSFRINVILYV